MDFSGSDFVAAFLEIVPDCNSCLKLSWFPPAHQTFFYSLCQKFTLAKTFLPPPEHSLFSFFPYSFVSVKPPALMPATLTVLGCGEKKSIIINIKVMTRYFLVLFTSRCHYQASQELVGCREHFSRQLKAWSFAGKKKTGKK